MSTMRDELDKKTMLLRLVGDLFNSVVEGLSQVDPETRKKIMELCGETCAREELYGPALDIAHRIAEEETGEERILERANREILWCGTWSRKGDTIQCICEDCGCPLVRNNVVKLTATFCLCSKGWVKTIFEALLQRPIKVDLEKSRGFGDDACKYVVYA